MPTATHQGNNEKSSTQSIVLLADQSAVEPILRRAIDKLPVRHKLNLLFVLWPPLITTLDTMTRHACNERKEQQVEDLLARALLLGLKAVDSIKDYSAPAWPMRVVDAFTDTIIDFMNLSLQDPYTNTVIQPRIGIGPVDITTKILASSN